MTDTPEQPKPSPDYYEEIDDGDDFDAGDECGRWDNGPLTQQCRLAGTEFCDWECLWRLNSRSPR